MTKNNTPLVLRTRTIDSGVLRSYRNWYGETSWTEWLRSEVDRFQTMENLRATELLETCTKEVRC